MPVSKAKQHRLLETQRRFVAKEIMLHKEQVAINLFDLERIDTAVRNSLLIGRLDPISSFDVDTGRKSDVAVKFSSDQELLPCCCICDIIRSTQRAEGDRVLRVYVSIDYGESWKLVGSNDLLTLADQADKDSENPIRLNPDIFPRPINPFLFRLKPKRIDRTKTHDIRRDRSNSDNGGRT